ncbi:MAG TPA: winged helix-turn-helix transcriptional regulator [Pseudonocardiaceae bacterium]
MVDRRSYGDPCGVARALDAVGERWALLVVRELLFGPKRYADLSRGLPGMSQNVLSQRLRELEQEGIVARRRLGPPASIRVYELTERGQALEPVLTALSRWGSRTIVDPTAELSVDALMLALRTTFDAGAAGDLRVSIELRFADDRFHAEIESGRCRIARGAADHPDAVLDTDAATLRSVVFGGRPLMDVMDVMHVIGDRRGAARFVGCFPRPTPFEAGEG